MPLTPGLHVAAAGFAAEDAAELSFEEGDLLTVVPSDAPEGWCLATTKSTGRTGLAPSDFLDPVVAARVLDRDGTRLAPEMPRADAGRRRLVRI